MITPGRLDLHGHRWVPFVYSIEFFGIDMEDAEIEAQVRIRPDAAGDPIATFSTVLSTTVVDGVPYAAITLSIAEATMNTMPQPAEAGGNTPLFWDLIFTPDAGYKQLLLRGDFIVNAGVTHG